VKQLKGWAGALIIAAVFGPRTPFLDRWRGIGG
jgi:hypothetical protein